MPAESKINSTLWNRFRCVIKYYSQAGKEWNNGHLNGLDKALKTELIGFITQRGEIWIENVLRNLTVAFGQKRETG